MTLFNDESTILEEVAIDYDKKVATYDDYGDDMYVGERSNNSKFSYVSPRSIHGVI